MICTAAGREGINLQHARVLFNFDLPWNPMDIEQRIGRIHRYGQRHTAQVYNLVLSDTIEGRIFLLLDDKLKEIAKALGKVDEHGEVAEDLRTQILGQLSERLNYESLYSQARQRSRTQADPAGTRSCLVERRRSPPGRLRAVPGPRRLQPGRLPAVLRYQRGHGPSFTFLQWRSKRTGNTSRRLMATCSP